MPQRPRRLPGHRPTHFPRVSSRVDLLCEETAFTVAAAEAKDAPSVLSLAPTSRLTGATSATSACVHGRMCPVSVTGFVPTARPLWLHVQDDLFRQQRNHN